MSEKPSTSEASIGSHFVYFIFLPITILILLAGFASFAWGCYGEYAAQQQTESLVVHGREWSRPDIVVNEASVACSQESGTACFKLADAEARLGNVETATLLRVKAYQLWKSNCGLGHSESCELLAKFQNGTLTFNCKYTDFECFREFSRAYFMRNPQYTHMVWSVEMHDGIASLETHSKVKCEFVKVGLLTRTTCTK